MTRNARTGLIAALLACTMVGVGYAAVPLYQMFCQVTGFNGTTQRASANAAPVAVVKNRTMSIRFDGNTAPGLPWSFRPEHPTDTVSVGARDMAIFIAKNESDQTITGTATFKVTPSQAGPSFTKITLKPGETMRMPVLFYVDPKILQDRDASDVQEITLSYTFFPVDPDKS